MKKRKVISTRFFIAALLLAALLCVQPVLLKATPESICEKARKDLKACVKKADEEFDRCKAGDETYDTICYISYVLDLSLCWIVFEFRCRGSG